MSTNRPPHERLPAWFEDYPEPTVIGCIVIVVMFFLNIGSLS